MRKPPDPDEVMDMLSWICPDCGCDCAPSDSECPECADLVHAGMVSLAAAVKAELGALPSEIPLQARVSQPAPELSLRKFPIRRSPRLALQPEAIEDAAPLLPSDGVLLDAGAFPFGALSRGPNHVLLPETASKLIVVPEPQPESEVALQPALPSDGVLPPWQPVLPPALEPEPAEVLLLAPAGEPPLVASAPPEPEPLSVLEAVPEPEPVLEVPATPPEPETDVLQLAPEPEPVLEVPATIAEPEPLQADAHPSLGPEPVAEPELETDVLQLAPEPEPATTEPELAVEPEMVVAQPELAPIPAPVAVEPELVAEPESIAEQDVVDAPESARFEPESVLELAPPPEPAPVQTELVASEPQVVEDEPELLAAEPELVAVESAPETEPEFIREPEPVAEAAAREPEPALTEPEPAAAEPKLVAAEPVAIIDPEIVRQPEIVAEPEPVHDPEPAPAATTLQNWTPPPPLARPLPPPPPPLTLEATADVPLMPTLALPRTPEIVEPDPMSVTQKLPIAVIPPIKPNGPWRPAIPGWLISLVVATALSLGGAVVVRNMDRAHKSAAPVSVPVADTPAQPQDAFAGFIEVTGLRMIADLKNGSRLHYVVVNHSAAQIANAQLQILVRSAAAPAGSEAAKPLFTVSALVTGLAPYESRDMTADIENLNTKEIPDWQFLKPEVRLISQQ